MKFLLFTLLLLALIGAADAGYLVVATVSGGSVVCPKISVGGYSLSQCNAVLASQYSKMFGLPIAVYGLSAYLLFAILIIYELAAKRFTGAMKAIATLSSLGVFYSAYLTYLQFNVINVLCLYCLVSAALITLIFIGSVVYNFRYSAPVIT